MSRKKPSRSGKQSPYVDIGDGLVYTPSKNPPSLIAQCYDADRYRDLLARIDAASLSDDVKEFLRLAAVRFVRFRFNRIADYYAAHRDNPELRELFERLCLVIVDLEGSLPSAVVCYVAMHDNTPVGLCVVSGTGSDRVRRISRIVIMPDYQGIGIGGHFMDWVARHYVEKGCRIRITATHPAVIRHCLRTWKFVGKRFTKPHNRRRKVTAMTRAVCTFEYVG